MKRGILLISFFSILINTSFSQVEYEIDSLENNLKELNFRKAESGRGDDLSDTIILNTLLILSEAYLNNDLEKALDNAESAVNLSQKIGYKEGICLGFNSVGMAHLYKGDYLSALKSFKTSFNISDSINFSKGIMGYYFGMFEIYYFQSRYPEALKYLLESIHIAEKLNDEKELARCYSSIGSMYKMQQNFTEAINNYNKAFELYEKIGDKFGITLSSVNIGRVYMGMKNYTESLKHLFNALDNYKLLQSNHGIAVTLYSIGQAYYFLEKYDNAERYTTESLNLYITVGNKNGIANCYNTLGRINTKIKNYKQARMYLNQATNLSREIGRKDNLKNNYLDISVLDSAEGNYKQAYENHKLFFVVYDSIHSQENTQKITQQKMQFIFDRKQVADSIAYASEKELAAVKLQQQRAMTFGGFGVSVLTAILLFLVYSNYKKQRRANRQLKEAQEQLIRNEKMAAFGVMASRVSHEIQNPINFVNNFSELSKELVNDVVTSPDEKERKQNGDLLLANLAKIIEHGNRAASIVKQLQEHSNKGTAHDFFEN